MVKKGRLMEAGILRRSLGQRGPEDLVESVGDAYVAQEALPLCSFTGLACVDSGDSSRCTFYWVDAGRGLLGRGLVEPLEGAGGGAVPASSPSPLLSKGPGQSVHTTLPPRLAGVPRARQGMKAAGNEATCSVDVLLKGLKRPLRIAVAPGKVHRRFIFFTEGGEVGHGQEEDMRLCVYDTQREETRVLASSLCDIRGLQVTASLDVVFIRRPDTAASDVHVCVISAREWLLLEEPKRHLQQPPAVKHLVTLCEKPRFGHATRHQDVTLLPNGVILVAVRIADRQDAESGSKGAVYAYIPEGEVPLCNRPWPKPLPPQLSATRSRKFDYEEYVRQYTKWRRRHPLPVPMEEPPVLATTTSPPHTHRGGARSPSLTPPHAKGGATAGNKTPPKAGAPVAGSSSSSKDPMKKTSVTTTTSAAMTATTTTGTQPKGKRSPMPAAPAPPPKPPAPPEIPRLKLPPPPEDDPYFYQGVPQPPTTARAVRSRFMPCGPSPLRPIDQLRYPEAAGPVTLLGDLPVTRAMAFSPATLRVMVGFCGAVPGGLPPTSLGEMDPWDRLAMGVRAQQGDDGDDGDDDERAGLSPLLKGFMVCMAMDGHGTVLLRSARADGQLLVLWAKGTVAWRRLRLAAPAAVPLPLTPRKELKEEGQKRKQEEEEQQPPPQQSQEESGGRVSIIKAGAGVVAVREEEAATRVLDGKAAEWSKGLIASMPDDKKEQCNVHANNTFTDSGRVNTLVVLRCRPLLSEEKEAGAEPCLVCTKNDVTVDGTYLPLRQKRSFHFDRVYDGASGQVEIYNEVVAPVVQRVLQGYSCTVFAYGQTGSGKTFTMEGSMDDGDLAGIIPRSIYNIFEQLGRLPKATYRVKVSHVEIYNEQFRDLLKSHRKDKGTEKLRIEDKGKTRRIRLRGAREIPVRSPHNIFQILRKSIKNRHTAETRCNRQSSRSHAIFTVRVKCSYTHPEDGDITLEGSLNLVDLSGSENIKRSGAEGLRAREAGTIGQSLLAFSRVITGLVNGGQHIPYRDSKLTHLLADSLGGKSYTTIILNVTPSVSVLDETMNTLNYASLARNVYSKPAQSLQRKDADGDPAGPGRAGRRSSGVKAAEALPVRPWVAAVPMRRVAWHAHHHHHHHDRATVDHVYHCQALDWVASNIMQDGQLHDNAVRALIEIFRKHDGNRDGVLTLTEVRKLHKEWTPDTLHPQVVEAWTPTPARVRSLARATLPLSQFLAFALDVARRDPLLMFHIMVKGGFGLSLASDSGEGLDGLPPHCQTPKIADPSKSMGGGGGRKDDATTSSDDDVRDDNGIPGHGPATVATSDSSISDTPLTSGFATPLELFDYLLVPPPKLCSRPTSAPAKPRIPPARAAPPPSRAVPLRRPLAEARLPSSGSIVTLDSMDSITLASLMMDDEDDDEEDGPSDYGSETSSVYSPAGSSMVAATQSRRRLVASSNNNHSSSGGGGGSRRGEGGSSKEKRRPMSAPPASAGKSRSSGGGGSQNSGGKRSPSPSRHPISDNNHQKSRFSPGAGVTMSPATPKPYHTARSPAAATAAQRGRCGSTPTTTTTIKRNQQHAFFSSTASPVSSPLVVKAPLCEWCSRRVRGSSAIHSIAYCQEDHG